MYVCYTYICVKRDPYMWQGTDKWKETYTYEKRLICMYVTHVYVWQKSHTCDKGLTYEKRLTHMKRDLYVCMLHVYMYEKRPIHMKRGLYVCMLHIYMCEKRPIHVTRDWQMKRDLHIWKEIICMYVTHVYVWQKSHTCDKGLTYEKRLTHMKRGLYVCILHVYMYEKRPIHVTRDWQMKRDLHIWKEIICMYVTRIYVWKETHVGVRGLTYEKRLTHMKRDLHIWKETYTFEKRLTHMKRDLHIWKEAYMYVCNTYVCMNRDPCMSQGTDIWKETYIYEKRLTYMKRDPYMRQGTDIWEETDIYETRLI